MLLTIHELFRVPKEVLFKLNKKRFLSFCLLPNHFLYGRNDCLMLLLLREQGAALVGAKSVNIYQVGFLHHTRELIISQGYFWLKQSVQWTLVLLYNCNQKSSGSLNHAVVLSQVICEESLPSGVRFSQ